MPKVKGWLWLAGSFLALVSSARAQPDATEIIRRADQRMRGSSSYAEMTMTVVKPKWSRKIEMKSWTKGENYALILITAPARDRGTAFLMRDKEVWNWIPAVERVIKIPPSMMMQSWMGSDFTHDDLVKESSLVSDYTHHLVGDTLIEGREAWTIELRPKEEAGVVWGRIATWIAKEHDLQLGAIFYDEDGTPVNLLQTFDFKMLGGRLLPSRLEMCPVDKPGQKTVLTYEKLEFDLPIAEEFFSEANMRRVH